MGDGRSFPSVQCGFWLALWLIVFVPKRLTHHSYRRVLFLTHCQKQCHKSSLGSWKAGRKLSPVSLGCISIVYGLCSQKLPLASFTCRYKYPTLKRDWLYLVVEGDSSSTAEEKENTEQCYLLYLLHGPRTTRTLHLCLFAEGYSRTTHGVLPCIVHAPKGSEVRYLTQDGTLGCVYRVL